jgi:ribosomal protein S1
MNSGTVFAGNDGATTSTPGKRVKLAIGEMSLRKLNFRLSYRTVFQQSLADAERSV